MWESRNMPRGTEKIHTIVCKDALGRATGVSRHLPTTGAGAGSAGYRQGRAAGAEEVYGFSPAGVLTTIAAPTPETDGTAPSAAVVFCQVVVGHFGSVF